MKFYSETLGLSDVAFALLRDLVHERTGLYFDNGKCELLADKLSPLVIERGLSSFLDYYYFLKYDPDAPLEWQRVMNALSVQETFFYREIDQINALVNAIVPRHFAEHPRGTLRIWSAACASGEEPLTIAMALAEAGWLDRVPIKIVASDASTAAIERAKRGAYRERSFRNLPDSLKAKYFSANGGCWDISPTLQAHIHYEAANLMEEPAIEELARSDVVFCRNVFIYFSEQSMLKTVQSFYKHMRTPGYLFIGASESLLRLGTHFELDEIDGAFVYTKKNTGADSWTG